MYHILTQRAASPRAPRTRRRRTGVRRPLLCSGAPGLGPRPGVWSLESPPGIAAGPGAAARRGRLWAEGENLITVASWWHSGRLVARLPCAESRRQRSRYWRRTLAKFKSESIHNRYGAAKQSQLGSWAAQIQPLADGYDERGNQLLSNPWTQTLQGRP